MKLSRLTRYLLIAASACCVSSVSFAAKPALEANLGFVQFKDLPAGSASVSPIRFKAMQETAVQLGANGALAWESLQIDNTLKKEAKYLDHTFDFNQLLLNNNVLPPVLVEADNSLNLASGDAIRTASKIYKIQAQARFVTAPPNWRSYLWMDYPRPQMPDHTLLPTTQAEANVWNSFIKEGWAQGVQQANEIFQVNLNRLKRDYQGMILYRQLLAEHMVSAPFVAKSDLGVTGNAKQIRINDRVLRITAHSQLQPNSKDWTPILTK